MRALDLSSGFGDWGAGVMDAEVGVGRVGGGFCGVCWMI